ncbi:MAG: hypothetical protein R6T89_05505 [Candidatus Syntrophosphaera sp.]
MNKKMLYRIAGIVLIIVMLFSEASLLLSGGGVMSAEAAVPGPNVIFGLFRTLGALSRRNRIYEEARATSRDINDYYDQLLETAQSEREDLIRQAVAGEKPPEFVRSYVRLEAALEAERAAAIEMVEQEKNQARVDFEQTLVREFTRVLIASPGGQKIIRDVRETIARAREAAVAVQTALEGGKPIEALGEALADKVGEFPVARELARGLGSMAGRQLDQVLGGALTKMEGAVNQMQAGMGDAITVLDEIDVDVARYDRAERKPVSLLEDDSLVGEILPVDQTNAAVDVVASAFAGAAELAGVLEEGTSRETMKDRIRGALLADRLSGLAALKQGETAGEAFCAAVGLGEYQAAAAQLGDKVQAAEDPERAAYLVCYDLGTGQPVYASLLGADDEEEQATLTAVVEGTPADDRDSSGGFPLGEHRGSFHLSTQNLLTEFREDDLSITVDEDGNVTGSAFLKYWMGYTNGEGCIEQIEVTVQGPLTGQIEQVEGTYYSGVIDFSGKQYTTIIEDCGVAEAGEKEIFRSGEIEFWKGGMRGSLGRDFYFKGK